MAPADPARQTGWHSLTPEEALAALKTTRDGLSSREANERLAIHGPNRLPEGKSRTVIGIFLKQFLNPLIYVLLAATIVSIALGHMTDAFFILGVLAINAIVGTIQEAGAESSARALRKLVESKARVRRDGSDVEIDATEVVPGDLVLLESGNKIPADLRLTSSTELEVNESLLTGESLPVPKDAGTRLPADAPLADRRNIAHAGTLVARGRASGIVVGTGAGTAIGKIAESLAEQRNVVPPLLLRLGRFTRMLALGLLLVTILIAAFLLTRGTPWVEVMLISVALAVSVIPEGLPVAVTVALAIAVNRMSKRRVITRHLAAVEALGSCTFIASDKTGTLTVNQLTIRRLRIPGAPALPVTGEGYVPDGRVSIPDTRSGAAILEAVVRLSRAGALCNEGHLARNGGDWTHVGDAVDIAFLVLAEKIRAAGQGDPRAGSLQRIAELPFESKHSYAAAAYRLPGGDHAVFVKGAPERVLAMCSNAGAAGDAAHEMASEGFRLLALAEGRLRRDWDGTLRHDDLSGLEFLGFAGMIDPLRPEAKLAVRHCRDAGVRVAMVTGDHPITAMAIARDLDLDDGTGHAVTGRQIRQALDREGPEALDRLTRDTRVFARVEPEQKLEIVRSLARNGHFVAVTGDGVNDAPALKEAHVGVAMGLHGTDVARESADLILTDDNFASIVAGIEEGRVAYANVRKLIFLLTSTGAAELIVFFACIAAGLPMPLTAVQLLWLNVVTNGVQDVALAFEPGEGDEMDYPPRPVREPLFNRLMLERAGLSGAIGGLIAFVVFSRAIAAGEAEEMARNSTLLFLVLYENILLGAARTETKSVFALSPLRNTFLLGGAILAQLIHLSTMQIPVLGGVIGTHPVSLEHWAHLLSLTLIVIVANEIYVRARGRKLRSAEAPREPRGSRRP